MKLLNQKNIVLFLMMLFALSGCEYEDNTDTNDEEFAVNKWIDEVMREAYLWKSSIPSTNYKEFSDPGEYFNKLLNKEDVWSWITDDWSAYQSVLNGIPETMGYSPAFIRLDKSAKVCIAVEYVYKNSPADKAKLKRGDLILTINGTTPDTTNYYQLYSGKSYTVGLGTYSKSTGTVISNGKTINLTAAAFTATPVLHREVKEIESKKIGYMVYSDFTCGINDAFLDTLDKTMSYFKEEAITDLIVDLRYNPGGEMAAAAYFASALAPSYLVEDSEVLIRMIYNSYIQSYFRITYGSNSDRLVYRFPENETNLNLKTIYFLTGKGTASASELLISGLDPYMNVVQVGDTTRGKYFGAWIIPDTNEPPKHNWCMVPIVLKYANVNGFTDFKKGLEPTIYVHDNILEALPFGDTNDAVLSKALIQITGVSSLTQQLKSASQTRSYRQLIPKNNIREVVTFPVQSINNSFKN